MNVISFFFLDIWINIQVGLRAVLHVLPLESCNCDDTIFVLLSSFISRMCSFHHRQCSKSARLKETPITKVITCMKIYL